MVKLRFSQATTVLIAGILGLLESTINAYPTLIPYPALKYFVVGLLPLFVVFLYKEETVGTEVSQSQSAVPA